MKTTYKISENPLSISSVAIKLVEEVCPKFLEANVLIIGAGTIGRLCLKYLQDKGLQHLFMCNRTMCTLAKQLTDVQNVKIIPYEARYDYLKQMDVVICATSSPHMILKSEAMPKMNKEIIFIDLAMPIDIDRDIGALPGVKLYDIDDFKSRQAQNLQLRGMLSEQISTQLTAQVQDILQWLHQTKVDPIIASFHEMCQQSQTDVMQLIQKKVRLSQKDYHYVEKLIESALNRVIREPIKQLKQLESEEEIQHYKKVIHQLFDF